MPWHQEPKKDVTNDEMLRGAVSKQRAVDIRMGEPTAFKRAVRESEVTQGTETSKYLQEEKEKSISLVAASEKEKAQTNVLAYWGCRTLNKTYDKVQQNELESQTVEGKSPVYEMLSWRERAPEYGGTRGIPSESTRTIW